MTLIALIQKVQQGDTTEMLPTCECKLHCVSIYL